MLDLLELAGLGFYPGFAISCWVGILSWICYILLGWDCILDLLELAGLGLYPGFAISCWVGIVSWICYNLLGRCSFSQVRTVSTSTTRDVIFY